MWTIGHDNFNVLSKDGKRTYKIISYDFDTNKFTLQFRTHTTGTISNTILNGEEFINDIDISGYIVKSFDKFKSI